MFGGRGKLEWRAGVAGNGSEFVKFHPSGQYLYITGELDYVHVVDVEQSLASDTQVTGPRIEPGHEAQITHVAVEPSGNLIATASVDRTVKVQVLRGAGKGRTEQAVRCELPALAVSFSHDETFLAAGSADGMIRVVSVVGWGVVKAWRGHEGEVKGLAFDPLRQFLASVGSDGHLKIWSVAEEWKEVWSGMMVNKVASETGHFARPAWHPKGRLLALPTVTGVVLLERGTWKVAISLTEHREEAVAVDWAPGGGHLVSAHVDSSVVLWDLDKRQSLDRKTHTRKITGCAWSSTGVVAVVDAGGFFALWASPLGKKLGANDAAAAEAKVDDYDTKKKALAKLMDDGATTETPASANSGPAADIERRIKLSAPSYLSMTSH